MKVSKKFLQIILILAVLIWGWQAFSYFHNYVEDSIFSNDVNPREITLSAGQTAEQNFRASASEVSGVIIFGRSEQPLRRKITVQVSDASGHVVAISHSYENFYRGDSHAFKFVMPSQMLRPKETYSIKVALQSGPPLFLKAREEAKDTALTIAGERVDSTLAFSLLHAMPVSFGVWQGLLAALALTVAVGLLSLIKSVELKWLGAKLIIFLLPLGLLGFWFSNGSLGVSDWDLNTAVETSLRTIILKYHQWPLWNPWACGGSSAIGNPEWAVLSIPFLLELIFGTLAGLKLGILFSVLVLGWGTVVLSRRLKMSCESAILVAMVLASGSAYVLRLVEGHIYIAFAYAWLPWFLWAWLGAYRRQQQPAVAAIFLALAWFQGGVYIIFYSLFIMVWLLIMAQNKKQALIVNIVSGLWFLGLGAVKLLPALMWLRHFRNELYAQSAATFGQWDAIFLGRHLHGDNVFYKQGVGWHEYGAYVGLIVLFLAFLSLWQFKLRLNRVLMFTVLAAVLLSAIGPLIRPLSDQITWLPRSNLSRLVLLAVLPLALLAGRGLDYVRGVIKWRPLCVGILGLAAIDLFTLSYPISEQTFVLSPVLKPLPALNQPVAFSSARYPVGRGEREYTRFSLVVKQGYGWLDYCPPLQALAAVTPSTDSNQIPFIKDNDKITAEVTRWSPNGYVINYNAAAKSKLIINQNYAPGWFVDGKPALNEGNRLSVDLSSGNGKLQFQYRPEGLLIGLLISTATIVALLVLFVMVRIRPSFSTILFLKQ